MVNHILRIKPTFFHIVFSSKTSLTYVLIRGGSSLLRILLDFPFHLPLSLVEETDDGPELAFTEDYLYFRIKYNICLSCRIFYHLDLFIQLPPLSLEMVKCHYTVHKFLLAFHFPFPNALPMTRIKMVMTMMTGLKDFSALEFIVWPPSSP